MSKKFIAVSYTNEDIAVRLCGVYDTYNDAVIATTEKIAHYNGYENADEWEDAHRTYEEIYDVSSFSQHTHIWTILEISL